MGSSPLPLSQEDEILLSDYEHYLNLWSYTRIGRRLAAARNLLHWWQDAPLDRLRPEHLAAFLKHRPKAAGKFTRTFTLFLERTGRLPVPQLPDPADVPLPGVADPASRLVGEFLHKRKRTGQPTYSRTQERSQLKLFLLTLINDFLSP